MIRHFILTFAFFLLASSVNVNNSDQPPGKKAKVECYFALSKTAPGEKGDRPHNSRTTGTCKGELTELTSLANEKGNFYGAPHELALVLARHEGRFLSSSDSVAEYAGKFICDHHLNELSRKWSHMNNKHVVWKKGRTTCGHYDHVQHWAHSKGAASLSVDQSERILKEQGILLHAGLPLCGRHQTALSAPKGKAIAAVEDTPSDDPIDMCRADDKEAVIDMMDTTYKYTERKGNLQTPLQHYFEKYAAEAGATRFRCRKSFHELSYLGQYSKVRVALLLENVTIEQLAGESKEAQAQLSTLIRRLRDGKPTSNEDHEMLTGVLDGVAQEFRSARNTKERVMIISLFARQIPYRVLSKYIDGLSERLYNQAKKKAIDAKSYVEPDNSKQRYDPVKLNHFVSFITSGYVMTGLPWGERKTKDSKGNVVYLPNYIRTTGIYETIELYERYMRESGRESLILSNSTTYRILKNLPAMKTTSLTCVDYFSGSATNAFIAIERMLDELDTLALIDHGDVKFLKNSFEEMRTYIKGNYRLHVKTSSIYSDHCLEWSLSDPKDTRLATHQPTHKHTHRSEECKKMDQTIHGMQTLLEELVKGATGQTLKRLKEHQHEFDLNVERIYDLKAHYARTAFTNKERESIIAGLEDDQALITLDYAQKFLAHYFRESQKLYFGKAGMSWHISHTLSRINGRFAQHSFVHLMKNTEQNSTTVVEIIRHTLSELKKMGIKAVHLRSDNAAYYHSSSSIVSIPDIIRTTGVKVLSWSFSEAQSGKSSSDRIAALVKRKMRDYVAKRNDIDSPEGMFHAITSGKLLQGLSVHLGTVRQTKVSPTKIDKISELGHFQYGADRMKSWRFRGIGEGRETLFTDLHPTQAEFLFSKHGGKLADASMMVEERENITNGNETFFWYVPPILPPHSHPHEVNDVDDDSASNHVHRNPINAHEDSLFYCPVCGASFIKHSNLVRHIDSGRHKIRPERVSLLDYALNLFKGYLEDIKQAVAITPLSDSLQALQTGGDEELEMGWALRTTKKGGRYPEKAKTFVRLAFEGAMAQGRKIRGEEVEMLMKDEDDIAPEERMTLDQIRNYIRTLAAPPKAPKEKKTRKQKTKTRGSRNVPIYTDEDGYIEEEVDVPEEDHVYTDEDIFIHVVNNVDTFFSESGNPQNTDADIGSDFE